MLWLGLPQLQRVETNRLPVGHTHEDIDQMFSVFSQFMFGRGRHRRQARSYDSIEALVAGFKACHTKVALRCTLPTHTFTVFVSRMYACFYQVLDSVTRLSSESTGLG